MAATPEACVPRIIVGAKRPDQLNDNIRAAGVRLSDDELAALDEVSRLPEEYPGWVLERQGGVSGARERVSAGAAPA